VKLSVTKMNQKMRKSTFELYKDFRGQESTVVSERKPSSNVLVLDGMNTFIRSWSVNPTMNENGEHFGGMVGFLKSMSYSIRTLEATRCIVVFDGKGGSQRRRKIYPEYKDRKKVKYRVNRFHDEIMTVEQEHALMRMQLVKLAKYLGFLPVTTMLYDNVEADDVMAYLATQVFTDEGDNVTLLSTDKDFLQLVTDHVKVYNPVKKLLFDPETVYREYGMTPENYLMYRVLDGDKSDNIPGIPGMGIKTVQKGFPMITEQEQCTVEKMLSHAEESEGGYKVYKTLLENAETLYRNFALMQLRDVNISGITKTKIMDRVFGEIPRLNKSKFTVEIMKDGLGEAFKSPFDWLYDGFTTLDVFAKQANEESV